MDTDPSLRERLIDAGVALLAAQGPAALGLREIARHAGVSHGAPRRHFPTHRALLSAIARRGLASLAAHLAAADHPDAPPRERLAALGRAYVGYAVEQRGMFELMFRHDLLDGAEQPDGQGRLREASLPLFGLLAELVGRHRGLGDPVAARREAAALWAGLHGLAQLWSWGSLSLVLGSPEADGELDRLVGTVLDAHLGGAA
ncbi:TetR family transcriptional regulator [Kitasatospora sp. MMS16-BH015]|uniref:TetR/AcrR family transcriptional regulator n=1 Tax=Kitasatospora sp. MMS16-BH015 TaxID=2018025 RepID=UPI000CA32E98|nr:TetR/AcrR family transcriptional regulator [Kitasatospora sp. MMS16-BH015]AUG75056.1 TetR family transcriptional regulator [Kitasatospora sp. MMS16-BH015]